MLRFVTYALPLLILLLALFGFAVELLDVEPGPGSVIRLALFEQPRVPAQLVLGAWLVESAGLLALYLIAQGRCGAWWLDGLVAGWLAWIFRGPLLVLTIVVAVRQPHHPWWSLAFGWWVLYSVCGLALAGLARRLKMEVPGDGDAAPATVEGLALGTGGSGSDAPSDGIDPMAGGEMETSTREGRIVGALSEVAPPDDQPPNTDRPEHVRTDEDP